MANSSPNPTPSPHRVDESPLGETQQLDYFDLVLSAAQDAMKVLAPHTVDLDLAETRCRFMFAGERIASVFLPALEHLVIPVDGEPDATFYVWDSKGSGIPMPPPPVSQHCFSNRGDIWRMESARIRSAFHWIESSVNLFDHERQVGVFWVPGLDLLPFWAKASPFRTLFHWWLESTGAQLLHGAAFGTEHGGMLLTGKGGVGKSTTALTCLSSGMQYVADDYLAVRLGDQPRAYSLYCTAKLDGPQMERFPDLARAVSNRGFRQNEKAVVQLLPEFSAQVVKSLPLRFVATPEFSGTPSTSFAPVSVLALQRAASFTTMSQLPHAGDTLHRFMQRLVESVPGFTIRLGSDLEQIPNAIAAMLERSDEELQHLAGSRAAPSAGKLVSVIIPVFNGASFLGDAVRCVMGQGYDNFEIVVVDDGSTDDLGAAVAALPIEVRLLHQENGGPAAARNRGIRDAGGAYLAFLDVDDLWPDGNLVRLVQYLDDHLEVEVVHGRGRMMRATESGDYEFVGDPTDVFPNYIGAGVYRRNAFSRVGLFDPKLRFGEDSDWFLRASECELPIAKLDEVCLHLRRHGGNMTHGKTMHELNGLRVMKLALDRRRAQMASRRTPESDAP